MIEEVGKVKLDYSKYPGEDLYCDGDAEDELLRIVKNLSPVEYGRAIEEQKSWPVLYHLSPLRENIVDWIPIKPTDKLLEIGSGCGAITGVLSRKAGSVTCVELSKKRSLINAYRHSECENVHIHVGNFKDIEPDLPKDFDYIFLIGVFEYGQEYIGGERPYEEFLEILLRHLKPEGRVVIAIENKYGLKYFAGCMEDHLGKYFCGIEDYPEGGCVRTFSRKGLERIFQTCGVKEYHFYYPYPDYKFMTNLYSDRYLPGRGELSNNIRNFDRERMLLFDEKRTFDGLVRDGLFSVFANSYLAVLGKGFSAEYVKYSNDRAPEYQIRTEIVREENGSRCIRKYPLTTQAKEHVRSMALAYEMLRQRYEGGRLRINPCELIEEENCLYTRYPFEKGRPLSELLDECLDRQDTDGSRKLLEGYVARIGFHEDAGVANFDPVFSNLLVDGDDWTLIDYEWTFDKFIPTRELVFRAVYCYLIEDERRNRLDLDWILKRLDINDEEAEEFRRRELEFQHFVTGKRRSVGEVLSSILFREVLKPEKLILDMKKTRAVARVQIYEDTGDGYREENSRFLEDAYQGERTVAFEIPVSGDVRMLRIDPALEPCICKVLELTFNGESVPLRQKDVVIINGRMIRANRDCPCYVFPTADPNININISALRPLAQNTLAARLEVARLSPDMAQELMGSLRKLW